MLSLVISRYMVSQMKGLHLDFHFDRPLPVFENCRSSVMMLFGWGWGGCVKSKRRHRSAMLTAKPMKCGRTGGNPENGWKSPSQKRWTDWVQQERDNTRNCVLLVTKIQKIWDRILNISIWFWTNGSISTINMVHFELTWGFDAICAMFMLSIASTSGWVRCTCHRGERAHGDEGAGDQRGMAHRGQDEEEWRLHRVIRLHPRF